MYRASGGFETAYVERNNGSCNYSRRGMHTRDMKISLCNFSCAVAYESFPAYFVMCRGFVLFPDFHWVSNDVTDASLSFTNENEYNLESRINFLRHNC